MPEPSFSSFAIHASPVVQLVLFLLLVASIFSWTFTIQRSLYFRRLRSSMQHFEQRFRSSTELNYLYLRLTQKPEHRVGLAYIFYMGFQAYQQTRGNDNTRPQWLLENIQRAMSVASAQVLAQVEDHLGFLATVGSTSPYVGLFGTVWGIMSSFKALSLTSQNTLAMIAPGISEALITTAVGLFVAIPAVIAYNRLNQMAEQTAARCETFQEELAHLFCSDLSQNVSSDSDRAASSLVAVAASPPPSPPYTTT